jgi:hypothetical protein
MAHNDYCTVAKTHLIMDGATPCTHNFRCTRYSIDPFAMQWPKMESRPPERGVSTSEDLKLEERGGIRALPTIMGT